MLQYFRLFSGLRLQSKQVLRTIPVCLSSKASSLDYQNCYSNDELEKILNIINHCSEQDLSTFDISKQRLKKIEIRKQKQGEFTTVEDILELDGFGAKVLEKFCNSILKHSSDQTLNVDQISSASKDEQFSSAESIMKKKQQFVTPIIQENSRKNIKTCVSFHFDSNCIAWTKLGLMETSDDVKPISVQEWDSFEISNDNRKRTLSELIQILIYLNIKIPHADAYVFEAQRSIQAAKQPGSIIQMNINLQKSQIHAMLSVLMASRRNVKYSIVDDNLENQLEHSKFLNDHLTIYFLKSFLASRLFNVYIGNERVSTEHIVNDILRYNYDKEQPKNHLFNSIDVSQQLRELYNDSKRIEKDYLGQSFLIGLTFMKLCILKCPQSMSQLNKREK